MNCVSCDICVYHLWFALCFFPGVFLSSRVTGACPVTTDLIMRVNVRTTTATTVVVAYQRAVSGRCHLIEVDRIIERSSTAASCDMYEYQK